MMENQNQIQKSNLATIKDAFLSEKAIGYFKDAIPSATREYALATAERFAKMTINAIMLKPELQQCTQASLIRAASEAAGYGFDIDGRGHAYLVPYKNKNKGVLEAQLQVGYKGLIDLAYRSGKVRAISAHCIYESERGQVTITRTNGQFQIEHPFDMDTMPSGDMVAVYATAEVDGCNPQSVVLRKGEVELYRQRSKAPNSPAWKNDYPAMAKKTAIRRLATFLPQSILASFQKAASEKPEDFQTAKHRAQGYIEAETGSEIIDVELTPENPQEASQDGKPAFMKDGINQDQNI